MKGTRAQHFEKETIALDNEETLSDLKQRVGSDSGQGVLLLVERRQACCLLMLVVFRSRDVLLAIKRIEISCLTLLSILSTLRLVDPWTLGIMVTTERDINVVEEAIHPFSQRIRAHSLAFDPSLPLKDKQ